MRYAKFVFYVYENVLDQLKVNKTAAALAGELRARCPIYPFGNELPGGVLNWMGRLCPHDLWFDTFEYGQKIDAWAFLKGAAYGINHLVDVLSGLRQIRDTQGRR